MARYRKIDPRIWNDEKFASLSHEAQRAFFFILTHPSMTSLGAFRISAAGMAQELGLTEKGFQEPFPKGMPIQEQEQEQEQEIKVGGAFSEKVADAPEPPPSDFCDEIPEEPFPEDWGALEPLPPPETKPAKKEKRGTRLDVQTLPDEWGAFVKERAPDLDPDLVFEEFKNYWVSQPGQKGVKLDWFATFRNNVISMPDGKRRALSRKHTSFEHVNYHEGINPDGSF